MNLRQIKVLQISSYPPPRKGWGMRIYFLRKEMEKDGHICEVLNIGSSRLLEGRDFIPVFNGLDYCMKILKYRLRGFLIHMHLNGDSPKGFILTALALLISICTFRRAVITFHAGPVQIYFPQAKGPRLTLLYKYIFTIPRFIICNNEAVKKNIMSYGINPDKIIAIRPFSEQYLNFDKATLPERIEEFFESHHPVICSYVSFRPVFFVETIVFAVREIVKKFPRFGLIIMGCSRGSDEIRQLIAELGLTEHIVLVGDQDHDTFLSIMSRSKMYLRTHIKDGVCSSVLEALSLRVPVVACEDGHRPESVITYENENIEEMVEKIVYVLNNHEKIVQRLKLPDISDTTRDEIELLAKA